jgi:hypothetical protein
MNSSCHFRPDGKRAVSAYAAYDISFTRQVSIVSWVLRKRHVIFIYLTVSLIYLAGGVREGGGAARPQQTDVRRADAGKPQRNITGGRVEEFMVIEENRRGVVGI